ncbi:hypothetical protein CEXT_813071 [Caerostris extrusa]|uniref:Uncharacterized protein n=1 Tax=Caerostris extrusa TaxID=172846 RepID=A0AAV4Y5M0_CAEEX|nr:hypothetical protein CEXT_813071 [Caerostris extrusa]
MRGLAFPPPPVDVDKPTTLAAHMEDIHNFRWLLIGYTALATHMVDMDNFHWLLVGQTYNIGYSCGRYT